MDMEATTDQNIEIVAEAQMRIYQHTSNFFFSSSWAALGAFRKQNMFYHFRIVTRA